MPETLLQQESAEPNAPTCTWGWAAVIGPNEAESAESWLRVELYSERLSGSTETPANDGTGLVPPAAGGRTSGTLMTCIWHYEVPSASGSSCMELHCCCNVRGIVHSTSFCFTASEGHAGWHVENSSP